jgi:hypothetical protein
MIGSTPRKWRGDGSPVSGDVHAGFCGGPGGEIPPGYPTGGVTHRAIPMGRSSKDGGDNKPPERRAPGSRGDEGNHGQHAEAGVP